MIAVITGASSGIGSVFARSLAKRGYDLILIARRRDRLEALARELQSVAVECWEADLADAEALEEVAQKLEERAPDLLVNNAGFGTIGFFYKTALAGQMDMHRLHVQATVRLTHAVLAEMVRRDSGAVINVSSVAAFLVGPGNVSYCATKAWMNAFTEGLYVELRGVGSRVVVQALCPGYTRSEFHHTMGTSTEGIPASMWLKAEDVVEASLRGIDEGRWLVVPHWKYRAFATLQRLVPKPVMHALSARSARKFRPGNFQ